MKNGKDFDPKLCVSGVIFYWIKWKWKSLEGLAKVGGGKMSS